MKQGGSWALGSNFLIVFNKELQGKQRSLSRTIYPGLKKQQNLYKTKPREQKSNETLIKPTSGGTWAFSGHFGVRQVYADSKEKKRSQNPPKHAKPIKKQRKAKKTKRNTNKNPADPLLFVR